MSSLSPQPVVRIKVVRLPHGAGLELPSYLTPGSAGMDLRAALAEPRTLEPGDRAAIPTGLTLALPIGFEAQVRPRSGLALKQGVTILNSPGTIDSDYRGEIVILLIHLGRSAVRISRGDRIAQLVVAPVTRGIWDEVEELPETSRGAGGFGHTGS